jgi:4'-phosphopantetheinyl transferase
MRLNCNDPDVGAAELHVWAVRLHAAQDVVEHLTRLLSVDEMVRARRFRFARDRRRFVVARAVLRILLARYTSTAPTALHFTYGRFGKPELAEPASDLRFSVSHSADVAVYAITRGEAVGVDVETVRRHPDAESLARRFFSPQECAALESVGERDRAQAFFNCWTRKEAYLKALGTGLSSPLDRFEVSLAPNQPAALRRVADDPREAERWSLFGFEPEPGAVGAAAVRRRHAELRFCGLHWAAELGVGQSRNQGGADISDESSAIS